MKGGSMDNLKQFPTKNQQPQQIQVDLKDAVPQFCECGSQYFMPAIRVFKLSALLSPTGQELTAQQPVLVCKQCGELLK
jgi:hypothetical protein